MAAIGIDLGTTNCCVAVNINGAIEIMPQTTDKRTISSYIAFNKEEIIFGDTAKKRLARHEKNTVYDVKRLIGRDFSDLAVQNYMEKWGFDVVVDDGRLKVSVNCGLGTKLYTPEELSGLLLKELKTKAKSFLDSDVTKAVITVPSYFNDAQRQATIDAGRIAGFKEVKLLNEPTAAAIAYVYRNTAEKEKIVFIFDLGGGTFDVSIVKYKNKTIDVLAIDGNLELGGNDIDNVLVDYLKDTYQLNLDRRSNAVRIKQLCEDAKKELSDSINVHLELYEMSENDVDILITRELFDKLNVHIYDETRKIIRRCLERASIGIPDIDEVILVGGSTKIRKVAEILEDLFKKPPKSNINPDEAVAIGAGIVASNWINNSEYEELEFNDICPYSLGADSGKDRIMCNFITKFTRLPAEQTKLFHPTEDFQKHTVISLFSGENHYTKDNNFLGKIDVSGYKIGPSKSISFDVTFVVDKSGVLTASVLDCTTGTKRQLTIKLDKGRFTDDELLEKANKIHELYAKDL